MINSIYLKRKADIFLAKWRQDENRKPLIIKGPRQVGKTATIRHFAEKANYESFIEINFISDPKYKKIIQDGYTVSSIIKNISLLDPSKKFITGRTLIFFDEITDFPEITTSLKFFKEDGRFDVICSGSLLGTNYKKIESNSVGYKTDYNMLSLDAEEFFEAAGYVNARKDMLSHLEKLTPFSNIEMSVYNSLFLDYIILGGMPEVVKNYINTKTFEASLQIQRELINDYKEDIRKYAVGLDQARVLNVFNSIPNQLAKENKKFQVSKIEHGAKFRDYRGCTEWLIDSGIVNACYNLSHLDFPLSANCDLDKFKLYFADSGLLVSQFDEESQEDLRENKNIGVYKGALYENVIAESLVKQGYKLYYYKKENSTLEEDFFIRFKDSIVPIEVKASDGRAKSLKTLVESDKYPSIKFGIKFCKNNIGYANNIYTFPYFCSYLLKEYMSKKSTLPA